MQVYYGTSQNGHLVPRTFDCVQCGRSLDMDEMVLLPGDGVEESEAAVVRTSPWLRGNLRIPSRWFRTVGWSYVQPTELMAGTTPDSSVLSAIWFVVLTQLIILGFGIFLPFGVLVAISAASGGPVMGTGFSGLGMTALFMMGGVVAALVLSTVWGLLTHLTLLMTGGAAHPLPRTLTAVYMSSGTLAVQGVPCVGPYCLGYVVVIWWVISAILMVMRGQRVSGLRASLAVLWPPLLAFLTTVGIYLYFISNAIGLAIGGPNQSTLMASERSFDEVQDSLSIYLRNNDGRYPDSIVDIYASRAAASPGRRPGLFDFGIVQNGGGHRVEITPGLSLQDLHRNTGIPLEEVIRELRDGQEYHPGPGGRSVIRSNTFVYCPPRFPPRLQESDVIGFEETPLVFFSFSSYPGGVFDEDLEPLIGLHSCDIKEQLDSRFLTRDECSEWLDERDALRSRIGLPPIKDAGMAAYDRAREMAGMEEGG